MGEANSARPDGGRRANYVTAAVCGLTSDQPATVCTAAIRALQAQI